MTRFALIYQQMSDDLKINPVAGFQFCRVWSFTSKFLDTGCPKKISIGPPKPQFLSETFEIFTVGRLLHSKFSTFFRFEKF